MRKKIALTAAMVFAIGLAGCGETAAEDIEVQNSSSELYVQEDMYYSMEYITMTLGGWDEVTDKITYLGDDVCSDEEILNRLNELCYKSDESRYTECMGYSVDFHASKAPMVVIRKIVGGEFDIDRKVYGYQFWFARTEGGEWENAFSNDIDIREIDVKDYTS